VSRSVIVVVALALTASFGCRKKATEAPPAPAQEPSGAQGPAPARAPNVRVTEVQLGNALGDDKRVKAPTTSFDKKDTVFASVITEGASTSTELAAKWTFQDGQVVNETKRTIAPGAMAVTEFSIQKPDGWPSGDYKLEISVDGKPVETKSFKVQ
jgi:hypothetical protein